MKKVLTYLLIGLLLLVLQALWPMLLGLRSGPEFLFLLVVFSGVHHRLLGGLPLAFFFGYCADALWGLAPGLFAMLYLLIFAICRLIGRRFYLRGFLFPLAIVFATTLLAKVMESAVLTSVLGRGDSFWTMLASMWRVMAWNLLFGLPTLALLEQMEKRFVDEYGGQFLYEKGVL